MSVIRTIQFTQCLVRFLEGLEGSNGEAQVREAAEALLPQEPPPPGGWACQGRVHELLLIWGHVQMTSA